MISGSTKVSPRAALPLPIGKNCIVQGDWKLITTDTSPDFWQGLHFPNSTSADVKTAGDRIAAYRESLRYGEELPPRPFPRLAPCVAGAANQTWQMAGETVCSADSATADLCWNVQRSAERLILFAHSTTTNAEFTLAGGKISTPIQDSRGCVGAQAGGELVLFEDCSKVAKGAVTTGFTFSGDAEGGIGEINSGGLCVAADRNGTHGGGGGGGGLSAGAFLFNVVEDPTEQKNLINDTAQVERIATMTHTLQLEVNMFFTNSESESDHRNVFVLWDLP